MATTRASQSPVIYGWGDCLNNKLANGIVQKDETSSKTSSVVDSMLPPPPPQWNRPKKVSPLSSASLSKLSEEEEDELSSGSGGTSGSSSGPVIIHGIACGAHNSSFIATGGSLGDFGSVLLSGAGYSEQKQSSLLCDSTQALHSPLNAPVILPRPGALMSQVVTSISLGNYHAALVTKTGQAYTWGWGACGQLGLGDFNSKSEPTHVLSLYAVHQVSCGTKFTAAVTLFGELYVFGENEQGQLGLGNTQRQNIPVQCKRLAPFTVTQVDCGSSHMAAISTDLDPSTSFLGSLHASANVALNSLSTSNNPTSSSNTSDDHSDNSPYQNLSCLNPAFALRPCAGVTSRVWTWGQSSSGKIETLPKEVVSLRGVGITHVACGEFHSLALSSLGQVFEWKVGEVPQHIGGQLQGHVVRAIDAGAFHSLALTTSGKLFSWGRSKNGQLGRTEASGDMTKPGLVSIEKKSGDEKRTPLGRSATAAPTTTVPVTSGSPIKSNPSETSASRRGSSPRSKGISSGSLGSTATARQFISKISAGEYHNLAIVERDPRRLLLWKILKKERAYLVKLHVIVDMYMETLLRLTEDESSAPTSSSEWQSLLGESAVVGTPHAATTANSQWHSLAKQYHQLNSSAVSMGNADGGLGGLSSYGFGSLRGASATASPRHRSQSSTNVRNNPQSPSGSTTSTLVSSNSSSSLAAGGQPSTMSPRDKANKNTAAGFRQMLAEADFGQLILSVFGNIKQIYRTHSQFVQELARVIDESATLGADARAAVDSVTTLWRFRLSSFALYASYADQYREGAYNLFMLVKSYPHVASTLKLIQELASSRFIRTDKPYLQDFTLKSLLLEPLRHVALETHLLRQLQDSCLIPRKKKATQTAQPSDALAASHSTSVTSSSTSLVTGQARPTHRPPAVPGSAPPTSATAPQPMLVAAANGAQLSRRPSLPSRPAPPGEALPPSLSSSQLTYHAPYLYATSPVISLDETLAHMSGLLERVCKNFNFVDATEILTSTMDERGFPQISGGSVELLVKRLTHHSFTDNEFVNAFLLTYRMFITPIQFLNLMIQRYNNTYPPGLDEKEKEAYHKTIRMPIQNRVVQVLLQWVQSPLSNYDWLPSKSNRELDENQKALHAAMNQFCTNVLTHEHDYQPHALMITGLLKIAVKSSSLNTTKGNIIMVGPAAGGTPVNSAQAPSNSPSLTSLAADINSVNYFENQVKALAQTLASQDFLSLKDIAAKDFLNKSWTRDNFADIAPGIHALTVRFNRLGSWVCYEVVNGESPKDRGATIALFIQLASELLELRDFNAFVAIMSGLNISSVSRLKKSIGKLSGKQLAAMEQMNDLASGKDNYRILRTMWAQAQPPAIPFLALFLKDLTFIEDGNPDKLEDGSTNFYKYRKMAEVIALCLSTRDVIPTYKSDTIFDQYLKKASDIAESLGEAELYKLSKKRE